MVQSMCFTWVITSVPETEAARMVLSDSGDILSPKYAPQMIAPAVMGDGIPMAFPIPISARPTVPRVPQEVPVAREVKDARISADNRNIFGEMNLSPR